MEYNNMKVEMAKDMKKIKDHKESFEDSVRDINDDLTNNKLPALNAKIDNNRMAVEAALTTETERATAAEQGIINGTTPVAQSENTNKISEKSLDQLRSYMLDYAHPIGSYYWSSVSTNPHELFGGTWVQVQDRFIYAAGAKTVGSEGGSKKITVNNLPAHHHAYTPSGTVTSTFTGTYYGGHTHTSVEPYWEKNNWKASDWGLNVHTVNTSSSGAFTPSGTVTSSFSATEQTSKNTGKNEDYMPEYKVAYCWYRTA